MLHPVVSTLTGVDFALFDFFSTSSQGKILNRAKSAAVKGDPSHCNSFRENKRHKYNSSVGCVILRKRCKQVQK